MRNSKFTETPWFEEFSRFQQDSEYAKAKITQTLSELVGRVIGEKWKEFFVFDLRDIQDSEGMDAYELFEKDGKIVISGRNGVSMASGFNYYLKNYAMVNYNPLFASNLKMPDTLPYIDGKIRKTTNYNVRYALNFCTYGYTMAFWGWKEYEALLDWFAMNGVNLMLDIVGQEEVHRRFLREYGYTDEEIGRYIPGPAYLPWFFMQNMSGFGGPLPEEWFVQRVELGRRLHDRMQSLGIQPVVQGYSGMVPTDFAQKHPGVSILDQGLWCGFSRPAMLQTYGTEGEDTFGQAADIFYAKQKEVFGAVTHYYAVDPFHEGGNTRGMNPTAIYRRVQEKMLESDPQAIWLLMQWQGQLTDEKICGFAAPKQVLILDLQADRKYYHALMERHEIPWIWCMVHNFGARMGVDGDVPTLAGEIPNKYHTCRCMAGIGIAPEAFNHGAIVYDLLFDMTWENDPVDCGQYVRRYGCSRYGEDNPHLQKAWDILLRTAYAKKTVYAQGAPETVINARPCRRFRSASTWGHSDLEYDPRQFEQALPEFIRVYDRFHDRETFLHDLADVTSQVICNAAIPVHKQMMDAYDAKDKAAFRKIAGRFLEFIALEDEVLSCCPEFSVWNWTLQARNVLPDAEEAVKDLLEFNARALITTWGDRQNCENCLCDYSNRKWSGLTGQLYYRRWADFVERYTQSLETGEEPRPADYFSMEWDWANQKTDPIASSSSPAKNLKALAEMVYEKYSLTGMDKEEFGCLYGEPINLALGKTVSGTVPAHTAYPYSNLTDGRLDTIWKSAAAQWPVALTVELGEEKRICEIAFSLPQVAGGVSLSYSILVWNAGAWQTIPTEEQAALQGTVFVPCDCTGSKVQLILTAKGEWQDSPAELTQLFVYGYPSDAVK